MIVNGVPHHEIVRLAGEVGCWPAWTSFHDVAFGLKPKATRYREVLEDEDDPGTTTFVVCQHGHEAFLETLFSAYPDAVVQTVIATYRGAERFRALQPEVRKRYYARFGIDTCDCKQVLQ